MTQLYRFTIFIFFVFYLGIDSSAQQNLFDYNNTLDFARYLKNSRQFDYASEEYERLFFENPRDTIVTLELAETYRNGGNCNKSVKLFENVLSYPDFTLTNSLLKEYLRFSLTCKITNNSFFEYASRLSPEDNAFYELSYYWANHKFDKATMFAKEKEEIILPKSASLYRLTMQFDDEKHKIPFLAGTMSAILPGSGKAYSNRWGDALISLLFVGSNSYASYRAFKKKGVESMNGWLFGTVAFSFYTANIWGSVKAAKDYNSNLNLRYQKNAEIIINNSF